MTGIEFYEMNDPEELRSELDPIIIGFLNSGYQNIPNCIELSSAMKTIIMKQGLAEDDIDKIALRAAIALGMKKKGE